MQQVFMNRILVLVIAVAWDLAVGDPKKLIHPVQMIGKLIDVLEKFLRAVFHVNQPAKTSRRRERLAGILLSVLVVLISTLCAYVLVRLFYRIHPAVGVAVEGILCGQMLAMKSLKGAAESVRAPLVRGNVEEARQAVAMIVGRDTEPLDEAGITRAAVETVAENTSDGIIAPMIFEFLFGAAGAYFYKSVNTMDSMIGYKNDRYRYFGTAAAKLDDIVNYLPSRITAVFMIAAARLCGMDAANAARIWRRDRRKHPSPNSAQAESVCAGALHVALAGPMYYFGELHRKPWIGDDDRKIEPEDIRRAEHLMEGCAMLIFIAGILMLAVLTALFTGH